MRKRKLTSPLSWFVEPKTTVVDLLGTKLTTVEFTPCKFTIDIKEGETPKLDISSRKWSVFENTSWFTDWSTPMSWYAIGGKKTLQVSKKEDIKFV